MPDAHPVVRLHSHGSLLSIPVFNTRSTDLRGKLAPAMTRHIRLQRESEKRDSTAD